MIDLSTSTRRYNPYSTRDRGGFCSRPQTQINLLPVEILTPKVGSASEGFVAGGLVSTDKLKVAKWENAFDDVTGNPALKPAFVESDIDRFYLKVPMPWNAGQATTTVKIKTESDPENEIIMTEVFGEPGVFRTKGLMLVSNTVDDEFDNGLNIDEGLHDYTHKVKLGDRITFTIDLPSGETAEIVVEVPVRAVLDIAVWHIDASHTDTNGNSFAVRSRPEVDKAVQRMKEAYAQTGVKVSATVQTKAWPQVVRDAQVGTPSEGVDGALMLYKLGTNNEFSDQYKAFVNSFPDGGSDTMNLYFLGQTLGSYGVAILPGGLQSQPGETPYRYVDNAFVHDYSLKTQPQRDAATPQHEALHLMTLEGHRSNNTNILLGGLSTGSFKTIFGRKRITQSQEEKIYGHAAVKDVKND